MQTFLPYADYQRSAQALDWKRLGCQRKECKQLILGQWPHHPAALMWHGYEASLLDYALAICDEWIERGYRDNLRPFFHACKRYIGNGPTPHWLGGPIHASHRAALLEKAIWSNTKIFAWYEQFGWAEQPALAYHWPKGQSNVGTHGNIG